MKISCGIAPGEESVELAKLAEKLGYERVWLFDSASLYEDVWIHLALIAENTKKIGLGTAVLVPHLRHVMATASAVASVQRISGGRLACAFGTGYTACLTLGQKALSWKFVGDYVRQLKGLLAGEVVEVDGKKCQMIHVEKYGPPRPIETPILLSAFGAKGQGIAKEVADGLMGIGIDASHKWDWQVQMVNGTVLDGDESTTSPRVLEAAGPWHTVGYHAMWEMAPDALEAMPGGPEWLARIEATRPEDERHLTVHTGHVTDVTEIDRPVLEAALETDSLTWMGWVGTPDEIREKVSEAEAAGATELLYTPAGPDIARELTAFAKALI